MSSESAPDSLPYDSPTARAADSPRQGQCTARRSAGPQPSWLHRFTLRVQQWYAVLPQDLIYLRLVLGNQPIELALPVLVAMSHAHRDTEIHLLVLLQQGHDHKSRGRVLCVIARNRTP